MRPRRTDFTVGGTIACHQPPVNRDWRAQNQENSVIRFSALLAAAFVFAIFVGGSLAQAQTASDPKSQPGSGQCRLSNGQRC